MIHSIASVNRVYFEQSHRAQREPILPATLRLFRLSLQRESCQRTRRACAADHVVTACSTRPCQFAVT